MPMTAPLDARILYWGDRYATSWCWFCVTEGRDKCPDHEGDET